MRAHTYTHFSFTCHSLFSLYSLSYFLHEWLKKYSKQTHTTSIMTDFLATLWQKRAVFCFCAAFTLGNVAEQLVPRWKRPPPSRHFCLHRCPEMRKWQVWLTETTLIRVNTMKTPIKTNTYISTHIVFVVHFAFLWVETVIWRAAVFLTRCSQAVWWRHWVILPKQHADRQHISLQLPSDSAYPQKTVNNHICICFYSYEPKNITTVCVQKVLCKVMMQMSSCSVLIPPFWPKYLHVWHLQIKYLLPLGAEYNNKKKISTVLSVFAL